MPALTMKVVSSVTPMTAAEALARAEALSGVFAGRAGETEALGRLPHETVNDIRASGIHQLYQPRRFGGVEADFRTGIDVVTAIGRGCGSTAWVLVQNITHNMMISQWSDAAQDAIWGDDPAALLSGILIPGIGRAVPVAGGYLLSGRWPFVSGVDVCDWALFTAMTGPDDAREDRHFVLPRSAFTILDTWHTMGLRGSSSNDVVVEGVFVPEHMTLDGEKLRGRAPRHDKEALMFQAPLYALFGAYIGSAALGIAEAAVDLHRQMARNRIARMSTKAVTEYNTQHVKMAEAMACVKAARLLLHGVCDQATEILGAGRLPTIEERARFRSEAAFAGQLSTRAVSVVWDAGGGGNVYDTNAMSRLFRDCNVANRHITQSWDANAGTHGRVALGMAIDNPAL